MDDQRLRASIVVIVFSALVALARVLSQTDPIYDVLEPVIAPLETLSGTVISQSGEQENSEESAHDQYTLALEAENSQLRQELGLANESIASLSAQVTRRDVSPFSQQVWLNVGRNQGVEAAQAVLAKGGLFGRVVTVYDDNSVVELITDPSSSATIVADGTLHGLQIVEYGSLIADLIPSLDAAGTLVETDGLDGRYPADIVLGKLGENIDTTNDTYGRYQILLPYNPLDVRYVQVLIGDR